MLLAAAGGLVYCYMHGLWLPFAVILAVTVAVGIFGKKYSGWRPPPQS